MALQYLFNRSGPLSMSPSQLGVFIKSNSFLETPDLQYHIQPLSLEKFEHPFAHRKFTWNSSDIEWIEDHINLFSEICSDMILPIVFFAFF